MNKLYLLLSLSIILLLGVASAQSITANIYPEGVIYSNDTISFECVVDGVSEDVNLMSIVRKNGANRDIKGFWKFEEPFLNGLPSSGVNHYRSTSAFWLDDELYIFVGSSTGMPVAYNWNGTQWVSVSDLTNGISSPGRSNSRFTHFWWEEQLNFIMTNSGDSYAYTWNGSTWIHNSTLLVGLEDRPSSVSPGVTVLEDELILIMGSTNDGLSWGWVWNGTGWEGGQHSELVNGLPTSVAQAHYDPNFFMFEDEMHLIAIHSNGGAISYKWNGTGWESRDFLRLGISGLSGVSFSEARGTIFEYENESYLIVGDRYNGVSRSFKVAYNYSNDSYEMFSEFPENIKRFDEYELECKYWYGSEMIQNTTNVTVSNFQPIVFSKAIFPDSSFLRMNLSIIDADDDEVYMIDLNFSNQESEYVYYNSSIRPDVFYSAPSMLTNYFPSGLYATSSYPVPHAFEYEGDIYIVVGYRSSGIRSVARWDGTQWVSAPEMSSGLPTSGSNADYAPTTFHLDGEFYLVAGRGSGGINFARKRVDNTWINYPDILEGLPTSGSASSPYAFWYDGDLYIIIGTDLAMYTGWKWNGEMWESSPEIVNGLTLISGASHRRYRPLVFEINNELHFLAGNTAQVRYLRKYNGTHWVETDNSLVANLPPSASWARYTPTAFYINYDLYLMIGRDGTPSSSISAFRALSSDKDYFNELVYYDAFFEENDLKGSEVNLSVRVYDFDLHSEWSDSIVFDFPNRVPDVNAYINSSKGFYITDLPGVCNIYDLDLNDEFFDVDYKWFVNGSEVANSTVFNQPRGDVLIGSLSSSFTNYGDLVVFSCRAFDGEAHSAWSSSSVLELIDNSVVYSDVFPKDDVLLDRQLETNLSLKINSTFQNQEVDVYFYWGNGSLISSKTNNGVGDVVDVWVEDLTPNTLYCWYAEATYNGVEFEVSETWCFRPNDEPKLLNLRIENINTDNFTVMWDNEWDMEWASFRIGSDIMEVRYTTGVTSVWEVSRLVPNKEYFFEFQSADNTLLAMSDYYNFMFRTFGWNPDLLEWQHKRVMTVDKDIVGFDQNDTAVRVVLTEENFQTCGEYWWDPCYPAFINMNYTDGSDLRFMDYYDYQPLRYEITYWNVPGEGGLSYTTIPEEFFGDGDWVDYENAHDGDWNSNAIPHPFGIDYFNYTIPSGAKNNSLFRIYAGDWGWDFELPLDCWGGDKLRFKTEADYDAEFVETFCQNNTDDSWISIWSANSRRIYETMMTWFYEVEVHITVMPYKFDDDSQSYVEGVDGDYNVKFLMYYGNPPAEPNQTTVNEEALILNAVSFEDELTYEVDIPVFEELEVTDTTATTANISWVMDQAVDNRLRLATNPYMLDAHWTSRIINRTQVFPGQIGNAIQIIQLDVLSEDYLGTVSVTSSNSAYNDNYTIDTESSPVNLIIPNLGTIESLTWTITYTENKTRFRNTNYADFFIKDLETDTEYYFEAYAFGITGNTTERGSFILGEPPSTPMAIFHSYSEDRPDKTATICFEIIDLDGASSVDFSIQYWNTTSTTFSETSTTEDVGLGVQCETINVEYGDVWSYRAKLIGNELGFSDSYDNEFMVPQEFFAGSYVTNNDQNLYRQYCPPDAEGYVDLSQTCYEQTGYREGSHRVEDWIWIETNITGYVAPYTVNWWDGYEWSQHVMSQGSDFHYIKLEDLGEEWQTFYVTDNTGHMFLNWTKPSMHHPIGKTRMDESKYVAFNITPTNISYQQFYMRPLPYMNTTSFNYCQNAPGGNLYDCMMSMYWGTEGMDPEMVGTKYDRGQTFRGAIWNGDVYDTGVLRFTTPEDRENSYVPLGFDATNATETRFCFSFTINFFDESIYAENNIENYYFRLWQEDYHWSDYLGITQDVEWNYIGLFKWEYDPRTFVRDWQTQEDTKLFEEDIIRVINGTDVYGGYNKSLLVGFKDGFEFDVSEYSIYEAGVQTDGQWNNYLTGRHHRTLVIFNLPDNDTLKAMDSSGDGISDYDALFVYYIDPFVNDTNENGWSDAFLIANGYDPNNPFDQPGPSVELISPTNNSVIHLDEISFLANLSTPTGIARAELEIRTLGDTLIHSEELIFNGETEVLAEFEIEIVYYGTVTWTVTVEDTIGLTKKSEPLFLELNPIFGCTDPEAINYDAGAEIDDGSCYYNPGCTDPEAYNYDSEADFDDGSCIPTILGCTDPLAVNYDEEANTDDGSCYYNPGCMDPEAHNYDSEADFDDGSCYYNPGCMDPEASNYDSEADFDDGSCIYQVSPGLVLISDKGWNIDFGETLTVEGINCPSGLTCNLYRGGVEVSNPEVTTLTPGSYIYVFNTSGNVDYFAESVNRTVLVNKAEGDINLEFNSLPNNVVLSYGNLVTVSAWSNTDQNVSVELDGSDFTSLLGVPQLFNVSVYEFVATAEESSNYETASLARNLTINKANPVLSLTSSRGEQVTEGTEIIINGSGCPSQLVCELYFEGDLVTNPFVVSLTEGEYVFEYNTSGNNNYNAYSKLLNIYVDEEGLFFPRDGRVDDEEGRADEVIVDAVEEKRMIPIINKPLPNTEQIIILGAIFVMLYLMISNGIFGEEMANVVKSKKNKKNKRTKYL